MCVHLLVNASVNDSAATFQSAVHNIHKLGALLPVVEWGFIFLPILFHAILGVVIIRGGLPNSGSYRYGSNIRYTLQRATGMIAFLFILWHVAHTHGWFHFEPFKSWMEAIGGHRFRAYNAASTMGEAMQASIVFPIFYVIGMLSCVFHLANGIWTMGITWGVWVTPKAQKWSLSVCGAFGVVMAVVGLSAIWGFWQVDVDAARKSEKKMLEQKIDSGDVKPNKEKEWHEEEPDSADTEAALKGSPASDTQKNQEGGLEKQSDAGRS